jgi:hypothetical protein
MVVGDGFYANGIEIVTTGARCHRFVTDRFDEEVPSNSPNNNQLGEPLCGEDLHDCDPKPTGAEL